MFSRERSARRFMAITVLLAIAAVLAACSTPTAIVVPETVEVLAPIDSIEILVTDSFPPQYFAFVKTGLPSACSRFDRFEVTREGDSIQIAIINVEPVGEECEDVYSTVEHNIPLGSDFGAGKTYAVVVNGTSQTFVTQGVEPEVAQVPAALDTPFLFKVGQTALVGSQGPSIEFVEVVEDSRCPTGATCIQAGRARILVRVSSPDDILGFGSQELTLQVGLIDAVGGSVTGRHSTYLFVLTALDPYPQLRKEGDATGEPDYTATLVVTELGATPRPEVTKAATSTPPCTARTDWFEHTVVRGETSYGIARRAGISIEELVKANCLENPRLIYVGQKLYVPRSISPGDSAATGFCTFFLIIPDDSGQSGPAVGCGDSAAAIQSDRARTGSLPDDITASLESLFSIHTATHAESGYAHSLYEANLTVRSVILEGDVATVDLAGSMAFLGVCADARMEAQLLFTVFQYPGVNSMLLTLNGRNVKQLFDMSGTVGEDEPYLRSQTPF